MKRIVALLAVACVVLPAAMTQAQSITTNPPTTGLSGTPGGGIFLDLTADAGGPGLFVTQFDMSIWTDTGTHTFELWSKPGSYVGFETNPAPWTMIDTFTVDAVADPATNPISFVLNNPLTLPAGELQGVYLFMASGGVRYTGGATPQTLFSNPDITLFSNVATSGSGPFSSSGGFFTPRVFAGTVHYEPIPEPAAAGLLALAGGLLLRRRGA